MKNTLVYIRRSNHSGALLSWVLISSLLVGGCATEHVIVESTPVQDQEETLSVVEDQEEVENVDPHEGFNRSMYGFNEGVDTYLADPITSAYKWIFPQFVQTGVSNFYTNLNGISVVLNDLLQGKFKQSGSDTGRFLLNSTVGLAGLIDVATYAGMDQNNEDFGQTLAVWGVPTGAYLVLPFVGPMTYRGVPGAVVDAAANPVTYAPWGFAAVAALNKRANAEGSLKFIDEAALDPYVFTRESYLQWRHHLSTDGKSLPADDLLAYDDDFFEDEEFDAGLMEERDIVHDDQSPGVSTPGNENGASQSSDIIAPLDGAPVTEQKTVSNSETPSEEAADTVSPENISTPYEDAERAFEEATRRFHEAEQEDVLLIDAQTD